MEDRLDVIIFGASGFTGKYTIPQLSKIAKGESRSLTWGVAGRSEKKVRETLSEMGEKSGEDYSKIPVIIADVNDEESLKKMTGQAKIIINTAGPYRFYGEPVIKACIETSTHHVDVSGEPQYMESVELKYNKIAKEKGIYIVSACGFDSIPTDLGIVFLQKQFNGVLNSVETYLDGEVVGEPEPGPTINYGTWESAIYGLANWNELKEIRRKLYPNKLPQFKPKLSNRGNIHKSDVMNKWALPFLGSDRPVSLRSQRYFYEHNGQRPVQVQTYFVVPSIFHILLLAILGGIFMVFCRYNFTRNLLLKYPKLFSAGFFSHEGPSEAKLIKTKFSFTLCGEGWSEPLSDANDEYSTSPDKKIICKVSGTNPAYGATCTALVLSALTILNEKDKLPETGGVYPPGAAYANTSIIEKLQKYGLSFEIVS